DTARLRPQRTDSDVDVWEEIRYSTTPLILVSSHKHFSCLSHPPSLPTAPTTPPSLVYFKITSVESDPASANGGAKNHPAYYGHGRRVDPLGTKMVQTGLEQSRVPPGRGVGTWVGGAAEFAPTPPPPSFTFTHTTTPPDTLYTLISSCLHPLSSTLSLSCTVLLHGPRGSGKRTSALWAAERCGVHVVETNCYDFAGETDAKTEASLRARFDRAAACAPCVFLIRNVDALARKAVVLETGQGEKGLFGGFSYGGVKVGARAGDQFNPSHTQTTEPAIATVLRYLFADLLTSHRRTGYPTMVVATTGDIERLPTSVLGCFRHEVQVEAPAEPARLEILRNLTSGSPLAPDVSLRSLATQTAALVAKDLVDLVARAGLAALERVTDGRETTDVMDHDIASAGIALTAADFDTALGKARASYSDSIGAPKIPNVTWDDVGGLAGVKDDILDTIQLPLEHPELFASGMKKRSGILLYGPPGTGKTLLAKAIATSCSLNFFSVKGPELLNMYIGESEANVRRVFQRARDAKPCVIFFDELDSVAPKRGEKGDSGGVMDRIVSQLLAELDGMSEGKGGKDGEEGRKNGEEAGGAQVFVIGATNRPDLLDPALLRPGRITTRSSRSSRRLPGSKPFNRVFVIPLRSSNFLSDHASSPPKIPPTPRPRPAARGRQMSAQLHGSGLLRAVLGRHAQGHDACRRRCGSQTSLNATPLSPNAVPSYPLPLTSQYYLSHLATSEDVAVEVTEEDFDRARRELIPSVSESELGHYRKVRERFEGGMKEGKVDGKEEKEDDESAGGMKETKMEEEDDENTGRMKEARDDDDKEEEDESAGLMKEAKVDDDEEEEDESAGLMKEEKEDESVGGMNEEKEDESAGGMKAAKVDGEEEDENAGKEAKVDGKEEEGEDKSVGGMKEAKLDGEEEEAGDESAGGMKEAEDESAGGMKEAEDESAGGIKEAEDESAGGMKEAKDKSAGRMKEEEAEDKNAGGMKEGKVEEEGDESTGGKEKVDGEEEKEKDESAGGKGKVDGEEEEKENESADGKGKAEEEENGSASGKEVKEEQDGEREGEGEDVMG
ncbi:P-loop containing nucleoside triphosphate hydrolase protein, partial [Jimgerdemannia flammicorona]